MFFGIDRIERTGKVARIVDDGLAQAGDSGREFDAYRAEVRASLRPAIRASSFANTLKPSKTASATRRGNSAAPSRGAHATSVEQRMRDRLGGHERMGTTPPKRSHSPRMPRRAAVSLVNVSSEGSMGGPNNGHASRIRPVDKACQSGQPPRDLPLGGGLVSAALGAGRRQISHHDTASSRGLRGMRLHVAGLRLGEFCVHVLDSVDPSAEARQRSRRRSIPP